MTSFNDADAVWQRYPALPRDRVDTRVAAVILELERERDEARAGLANAGDLLSWSRDLLEQVQYSYSLNDCDCGVCAECGEMPTKCSETECSQTCSCSECDGCRISALLAAIDAHAQGVPNDHTTL